MKIAHSVHFDFDLSLPQREAAAFVRDAQLSLSKARFISDLRMRLIDGDARVRASIPVNAALLGQHTLAFESRLVPTLLGARLEGLPLDSHGPGWAEVSGEAEVKAHPKGSLVRYRFDITIHLQLPEPEKWGGRALLKMIEFSAQRVLERIIDEFPKAVQTAAREVEAAYDPA